MSSLFAVSDNVLLHRRATLRKRDIAVSRNPLVWSLRTAPTRINSTNPIASQVPSGTTRKQVARHCYAAPCEELPICVAERYPTLRICLGMGAHCAPIRKKKSSAVPLLRSGHMSAICAVPSKGKGEIHKRVENRRLSTLLCACRAGKNRSPRRRKTIVYQKIIEYIKES